MNMDPAVRKYFPNLLTREESKAHINTIEKNIAREGYGLFAAEWKETGAFIGFIGFSNPAFSIPAPDGTGQLGSLDTNAVPATSPAVTPTSQVTIPAIEIGWRLSSHYWGRGLATEGARACLEMGFDHWNMTEVYSFTSVHNLPSEKVMIRIGMLRQGTFEHPILPSGHWLREHVLYKAVKADA
jgi:RimJ/RimL family protein N-acetyltransferase